MTLANDIDDLGSCLDFGDVLHALGVCGRLVLCCDEEAQGHLANITYVDHFCLDIVGSPVRIELLEAIGDSVLHPVVPGFGRHALLA